MRIKNSKTVRLVIFLLIFAVLFAVVSVILIRIEDHRLSAADESDNRTAIENWAELNKVYFNGEAYLPKSGLSSFLIMGIDSYGEANDSNSYNNTDQADFLALVILDNVKQNYCILHINRDTMAYVDVLGLDGKKAGTKYEQLALSHTYGNGLQESCENTVRAVSDFLFGVPIQAYVSVTMDAVVTLCDFIGGVSMVVPTDLTELDERLVEGENVVLDGQLALQFVRARGSLSDSSNLARMERQKCFLQALYTQLQANSLSMDEMLELFQLLSPDMVTNCSTEQLSEFADRVTTYSFSEIISPEGEAKLGNEFMEFYADDSKLKQLIAELFYTKIA